MPIRGKLVLQDQVRVTNRLIAQSLIRSEREALLKRRDAIKRMQWELVRKAWRPDLETLSRYASVLHTHVPDPQWQSHAYPVAEAVVRHWFFEKAGVHPVIRALIWRQVVEKNKFDEEDVLASAEKVGGIKTFSRLTRNAINLAEGFKARLAEVGCEAEPFKTKLFPILFRLELLEKLLKRISA